MRTLLIITFLIVGLKWTYGCDCLTASTEEYFKHAEVVFTGRVLKIIDKSNFWASFKFVDKKAEPREITLVQIEITEIFKGLNERLKYISIPIDYSSCQYTFSEGYEFLIYGNQIVDNPGIVMTWECSGNRRLADNDKSADTFVKLRQLKSTVEKFESTDYFDFVKKRIENSEQPDRLNWIVISLVISVIINIGLLFFLIKRKV